MFGGSPTSSGSKLESEVKAEGKVPSPGSSPNDAIGTSPINAAILSTSGEKRSGNGSPTNRIDNGAATEKKRRSSGVGSKASSLLASARSSLSFSQVGRNSDLSSQTPLQKLGKHDPALAVPQGQHNNSAGESAPGPKSTFRVGVWEDRNKKCRRTMEDTHAFLYNFLGSPPAATVGINRHNKNHDSAIKDDDDDDDSVDAANKDIIESDNGYFAIFDGHAGTFAADWCGKKLHIILEEMVRKNPGTALPELLDQTFTSVDAQLEKLPLKNSGCTAAVAVLRWEDRMPSGRVPTSKTLAKPEENATADKPKGGSPTATPIDEQTSPVAEVAPTKPKPAPMRQRVLYTANVGDARIILCRSGRALRLSYDHKGSDENEGKRIANAGGLILNNRVNGVLAVTRALGDTYMKDLVTGHPYTTETVIQPDVDEFIIIACDGLWDVCSDQDAVDLVRDVQDPIVASKQLVEHALSRFSTDNLSCMIVRFDKATASAAETDVKDTSAKVSEVDKIVSDTKQKIAEGATPAEGVSASNSGRGYDSNSRDGGVAVRTLDLPVQEEPFEMEEDSPEVSTTVNMASTKTDREKASAP